MTCDTCRKFRRRHGKKQCAVLTVNNGANGGCWAWTDDPDWFDKVQTETETYRQSKGGDNA